MADSVLFTPGSSGRIECNKGTWTGTGALTMAVVFKHTTGADQSVCGLHSGAFTPRVSMNMDSAGNVTYESDAGGTFDVGDAITTANGWVILAITKASGSAVPRVHIFRSPTWRHADLAGAIGNPSASTGFTIGSMDPGEVFLDGNILIAGGWDSALVDGTVESLANGYAAWIAASPKELIRCNAISGLVSTATGGTMSETGRTNTSVDTGDVPSWWDDAVTTPTYVSHFPLFTGRAG